MATKSNPSYEATAVNLKNAEQLKTDLEIYHDINEAIAKLGAEINAAIPQDLKDQLTVLEAHLKTSNDQIRADIDIYGSYQDVEKGWYAVKQRAVSKSYDPEVFEKVYPQFAPAIIIKCVDSVKLNGLIKGGLVTEADLKEKSVIRETESFKVIIK
jgi:hypothetical protein